jgi:GTP-binding protein EngB required for normal cell division
MEQKAKSISLPQIKAVLQQIRAVCDRFNLISLNRRLETTEALVADNPPIDVAVLGQFKAGKSSFLNSLIGQPVLPVGAIPVTTAITRLQYGATERAIIRHFNGSITEAPLSDIAGYTSEAQNPGNQKNVEVVDIELPTMEAYAGLRLVDTPGLGSVYQYHKSTSENWLPEVGAALLAISADRPLSAPDLELIRELVNHTPNIIILLTKADLLSEEQRQEVTRFFSTTLQRELHRDLPVYLYSTKVGTGEFKRIVENEIIRKLAGNRDAEFMRILRYKTESLVHSCLGYLEVALNAALQADQDRESLRAQILDEKVNEALVLEELGMIARENQRQTRDLIQTYLDQFRGSVTKKVIKKLEKDMPGWKGNLWKLSRQYETWTSVTMTEEMRLLSKAEHGHFYGTLKKAHAGISRSLEAFRKFLDDNIQKVLSVKMAEVEWKIDVVEPERPDITFSKSFDVHLDLIWFLIPMFLFRKIFERHFLRSLPREVEKNISRLAAQWEKRINDAIDLMKKQAARYIQEELATIDGLLSKTRGQTDDIRRLISLLKEQSNQ